MKPLVNAPNMEKGLLRYSAGQLTSELGKGFDETSLRRASIFQDISNSCHSVARIELVALSPA